MHHAVFQRSVARTLHRVECKGATTGRGTARRTETSESPSNEPRARQFSGVLVPGRIRDWDCARGRGHDCLNVFTPAARLLRSRYLSRDNLDENGGGNQSFEAAAGSEVMIGLSPEVRKHFFWVSVFDCR